MTTRARRWARSGAAIAALSASLLAFPAVASAGTTPAAHAHRSNTSIPVPSMPPAKAYVLVDLNTGNVLASYHEHQRLRPASLTKVLVALIAVTYLKAGATVPGTKQSWDVYPDKVGIEKGVAWPLDEVLQSLLVMSANDAAYALAQRIGGSLTGFQPIMDRSAHQIGMSDNPVFRDPAGLDGSEGVDGGNYASARDLAIAGRDLLGVPQLARIVKEQQYHFVDPTGQAHWLSSANDYFLADQPGAIGVKTGYTDAAGYCVMGAATKDGRTMLAVVMDGYNSNQTAMDLVDAGFTVPVADEPTADRLPPFALPQALAPAPSRALGPGVRPHRGHGPMAGPRAARSHLVGQAPGPGRSRPAPGTSDRAPSRSKQAQLAASKGAQSERGSSGGGGLFNVVGTLPGTLLVLAAATACLAAAAEYLKLGRLRRAQPLTSSPEHRALAWVTTLGGNGRHRDELVASYSRHERQKASSSLSR